MDTDDIDFEWDEAKRRKNLRKHGVDFADVVEVFYDPLARIVPDPDHHAERRLVMVGEDARRRVTLVVFTQPDPGAIRIVSARPATPAERRFYERQ